MAGEGENTRKGRPERPPVLLTREEAASWLRVSVRQLDRLVSDGRIASIRNARKRQFRPAFIHEYLESCTTYPTEGEDDEAQATADRVALESGLTPYREADRRRAKGRGA